MKNLFAELEAEAERRALEQLSLPQPPNNRGVEILGDAVDTVDQYTARPVRAAISAGLERKDPIQAMKDTVAGKIKPSARDIASRALQPLDPHRVIPGYDQLPQEEKKDHPLSAPMGFALDNALDPTNLIPAGKGIAALGMIKRLNPKAPKLKSVDDLIGYVKEQGLLHHTTSKKALEQIAEEGLIPQHGQNVQYYVKDLPVDLAKEKPAAFFSNTPDAGYIDDRIRSERGLSVADPKPLTAKDIRNEGGLAIFPKREGIFRVSEDGLVDTTGKRVAARTPAQSDIGDFVSFKKQMPDYTVSEGDLIEYLARQDPNFLTRKGKVSNLLQGKAREVVKRAEEEQRKAQEDLIRRFKEWEAGQSKKIAK